MNRFIKPALLSCVVIFMMLSIAGCELLPEKLTTYHYKTPGPPIVATQDPKIAEDAETIKYLGTFSEEKSNNIFMYSVYTNGIQINGFVDNVKQADLVIPADIDGKSVVGIGYEAFCDNSDIKSVVLPATVKYIGNSAFRRCQNIETVSVSGGLEFVGGHSFDSCFALKKLIFPDTVTYIGGHACALSGVENICIPTKLKEVPRGMYYGTGLKDFSIPSHVERINESAFAKCSGLTSVTIPGTVLYIGDTAFANNVNIKDFYIEEGCKQLEYGILEGAKSLESVHLPRSVVQFSSSLFPDANSDFTVYVKKGSKTEEFVIDKKIDYITVE